MKIKNLKAPEIGAFFILFTIPTCSLKEKAIVDQTYYMIQANQSIDRPDL